MVELFHDYYILTLLLLLSTFSLFNIWPVFSITDEFVGIFPEDYYNPDNYDQESTDLEKVRNYDTYHQENPTKDSVLQSTKSLPENNKNNINFIANCWRLEL